MSSTDESVILSVSDLSIRFDKTVAVDGLSLSVSRGEVFGFLGPNGAGKSSTMRAICGLVEPTSGRISVGGFDVADTSENYRRLIGYLPETTPLYSDMNVSDYLYFAGRMKMLRGKNLNLAISRVIERCGLGSVENKQISVLSKGFVQRVGLAQALLSEPQLLILDEPSNGLDPNQIVEMRKLIREIGSERAVVFCSHILPEVSAVCDRIMIINHGKAVASGTSAQLSAASMGSTLIITVLSDKETACHVFKSIGTISVISDSGKEVTMKIETTVSNAGGAVFNLAVENDLVLSQIRHEQSSLEDVFTSVTVTDS